MKINDIYLWCVSGITALVAINTLWKLWEEKELLRKEDLSDEDRAFVWRLVVFLVLPFVTFLDLRTTTATCELLGGYIKSWSFGLLWYHAQPAGLASQQLIVPVLFSGVWVTSIFALCLVPALFFRPHPFMATLIGYAATFILGLNFIADPLLSIAGLGSLRWQIAFASGSPDQLVPLLVVHLVAAIAFIVTLRSNRVRLWFSGLTRPNTSEELREALFNLHAYPENARLALKVGLLYDKAGLRRQAKRQLNRLKNDFGQSLYANFLEALIAYRRRDYSQARKAFIYTSDFPGVDGELKASLLAAAACGAFAAGDTIGALNLSERALEFDDACLVARMVKVDVFLRQGKKEQAGEEILFAMHLGLTLDLENKVPLDTERAFENLVSVDHLRGARHFATRI